MAADSRPNVLFMICDDLNNAIAGMGRRPFAPAPNLQRLMRSAVRFPNAYSNCPICLPSRSSCFSGIYPHATGHFTLWDKWQTTTSIETTRAHERPQWGRPLLQQAVMMPRFFKENGYRVYGCGKVFHGGVINPDWWTEYGHGPDYGPRVAGPPNDEQKRRCAGDPVASYVRRYRGIDRFFVDPQGHFGHHIESWVGPLDELFEGRLDDAVNGDGSPYRYASDDDREPLPDEKTAAWGVEVLGREHTEPFMLALGFMKPHTPLNAPRKYFDMFPLEELELPPQLVGDTDDCARALVEHRPYGFLMYDLFTKWGEKGWRRWLQAYLATVAFLDDQVGRVLDALEASPYRDNTIVVFTSDNGYHMGEKQYIFKDSLWEEGSQVPLIVKAPGVSQADAVCETPVSLIDLYPTLIDLCGLPPEPHAATHAFPLDGHSLRPLLGAPAEGSWDGPPVAMSAVRGNTGTHYSVRSLTHRYTLCNNGEEELYDHRTDPHEWHNLAADPEHETVRCELRNELIRLLWGEEKE